MKLRFEDNGDGTFALLSPVEYFDNTSGVLIKAPAGFSTDFASVPQQLQSFASKIGKYDRAAVIHDWLYSTGGIPREGASPNERLTRADADRIFREIMQQDSVSAYTRWKLWIAVRSFGWLHWRAVAILAAFILSGCAHYNATVAAREDTLSGYSKDNASGIAWTHRVEYKP